MKNKGKLSVTTNKKSVSEGEFIEIQWNCDACPDSLLLTIDSGYDHYTIPVADSGSTRIVMSRSKRKTTITLKAFMSGKKVSKSTSVRVKNYKRSRVSRTNTTCGMKMRKEKLYTKWCVFRAQVKYWWLSLKKWQKALWIALLLLWLGILVLSLNGKPKPIDSVSGDLIQATLLTASAERQTCFT